MNVICTYFLHSRDKFRKPKCMVASRQYVELHLAQRQVWLLLRYRFVKCGMWRVFAQQVVTVEYVSSAHGFGGTLERIRTQTI